MSLCVDCKAAGIDAVATRKIGKLYYCSSHARKYFPMGAALPPEDPQIAQRADIEKWVDESAEKEETAMPLTKGLDWDAIARDYQGGMSADKCAQKYGCHHTTVRSQLKKRGVYKPGAARRRQPLRASHALARPTAAPEPAIEKAGSAAPLALETGETLALPSNGQARCRVAMFEVEGDATAVQHAVDAIKAALEARG